MNFETWWKEGGSTCLRDLKGTGNNEALRSACKAAYNDAQQLTVGAIVTRLWAIAAKTDDKVEKSRIKNIAAQIAAMDL